MPLEKKYENNADIAAQQSIEIGNVFEKSPCNIAL